MDYTVQNWQDVYDDTFRLYENIRDHNFQPDIIIGVARGGWIPARLMADFLHLKLTANMKVEAYQMMGEQDVEAEITQPISTNVEGKSVLIVDDVADSGATLEAVVNQVSKHQPSHIKTAVLYYKPRSRYVPNFFVHKTSDWVVFSWSIYESLEEFANLWSEDGMERNEIAQKCKRIGIPKQIVDSYFAEQTQ